MLDDALKFAIERKQFGQAIAEFQLIQAMLADSKAEIYAAKCMVIDAARQRDAGQNVSTEASCAKMFATEMCGRVADRCVQIHGVQVISANMRLNVFIEMCVYSVSMKEQLRFSK